MRFHVFILKALLALQGLSGLHTAYASSERELVVYTYDSLVSKHGLGPEIFTRFEKKYGIHIKAVSSGDAGQLLARLQLDAERKKPTAQIVLGVDQNQWAQLEPLVESGGNWLPRGSDQLVSEVSGIQKSLKGFVPFDYGVFTFMMDRKKLKEMGLQPPHSLKDLLSEKFRRKILLEDPRTSTPGLAFLLFTREVYGEKVWDFWARFKTQWLTLTPGWDQAYGLFLKEEAPLVWSYVSSQAYHQEHPGDSSRFQALILDEGNPVQIEGAGLIKGEWSAEVRKNSKLFLEFLISVEVQKEVPLKNWMMPVRAGVQLPKSFQDLPKPIKRVMLDSGGMKSAEILKLWSQALR